MATSLSITTGGITETLTVQDDAAAQAVLELVARAEGAPEGAPPRTRLQYVLSGIRRGLVVTAQMQRRSELDVESAAEVRALDLV